MRGDEVLYSYLRGEMIRNNLTIKNLSAQIGISEKSLRNKLNGDTDFTWNEAKVIHKIVSPEITIDELFLPDAEKAVF